MSEQSFVEPLQIRAIIDLEASLDAAAENDAGELYTALLRWLLKNPAAVVDAVSDDLSGEFVEAFRIALKKYARRTVQ